MQVSSDHAFTSPINDLNAKGYISDVGTAQYVSSGQLLSSTTIGLLVQSAGGVYVGPSATSGSVPMTWASGDLFTLSGWYETV